MNALLAECVGETSTISDSGDDASMLEAAHRIPVLASVLASRKMVNTLVSSHEEAVLIDEELLFGISGLKGKGTGAAGGCYEYRARFTHPGCRVWSGLETYFATCVGRVDPRLGRTVCHAKNHQSVCRVHRVSHDSRLSQSANTTCGSRVGQQPTRSPGPPRRPTRRHARF